MSRYFDSKFGHTLSGRSAHRQLEASYQPIEGYLVAGKTPFFVGEPYYEITVL